MVTLTDGAVTAIQGLTQNVDTTSEGGLRIAADDTRGSLHLSLSPGPAQGDEVVETGGARLFLDRVAASVLDDKALDAQTDPDGQVMFTVAEQPG
jgi:Fe-S cluster assembly iron-binding protein IscA